MFSEGGWAFRQC
jgi:hypothetical protein